MTKINSIKASNGTVHKLDEGIGFPSSRYVDLELGPSETIYTAPANGWFYLSKGCEPGQYLKVFLLDENGNLILCQQLVAQEHSFLPISTMISKGQKWQAHYTCSGKVYEFRFIYAQGSEPEE